MTVTVNATGALVCETAKPSQWAPFTQGDRDRSRSLSHIGVPDHEIGWTGGRDRPLSLEVYDLDLDAVSAVQPGGLVHAVRVQHDSR